jgi:hypothetical protein
VERVDRPCAEPAACGGGQGDQPAGLDVAEDRLEPARESSVTGGGLTSARFGITASVAPVRLWSHEGPDALLRGRAERRFDDLSRRAPSPQAHREPLADGPAAAPGRLPAAHEHPDGQIVRRASFQYSRAFRGPASGNLLIFLEE